MSYSYNTYGRVSTYIAVRRSALHTMGLPWNMLIIDYFGDISMFLLVTELKT